MQKMSITSSATQISTKKTPGETPYRPPHTYHTAINNLPTHLILSISASFSSQQSLDNLKVAFFAGPHEGRLAVLRCNMQERDEHIEHGLTEWPH